MQPTTPQEFLKVALQRLTAAEAILENLRLTLEAQYIGGYAVECSLKALILEKTCEAVGGGPDTMTTATTPPWEAKRTVETRQVEDLLGQHFKQADSYRYNSASIRIRVIDPRFEGIPREKRDAMVEQYLDQLPPETQRDIVTLLTFAPSELQFKQTTLREHTLNMEFDDPSPSKL